MKRGIVLLAAVLAVVAAATIVFLVRKGKQQTRPDPAFYHTAEGVNAVIQEQRIVLTDALVKKDLPYIHGQMYYLQGLADALSGKLEGEKKQRVDPKLEEAKRIAEEIDNFSGRGQLEATASALKKLFDAFDALNAEFKPEKK
jgi:hypothetical protein